MAGILQVFVCSPCAVCAWSGGKCAMSIYERASFTIFLSRANAYTKPHLSCLHS